VHEMVVDGQTHGGIAQGLGQVLGEHVQYGDVDSWPCWPIFFYFFPGSILGPLGSFFLEVYPPTHIYHILCTQPV
ncbi:MAG: hypothetical protein EBU93_06855, partial [Chlamydiae bacterium]|nr:hypothetical protein [Chlamydiota bacterium]